MLVMKEFPFITTKFVQKTEIAVFLAISQIFSINGLTLKSWFGVVQAHLKWRRSIDHVRLSIGPPL